MKTMNLSEVLAKLEKDSVREFHVENNKDIRLKVDDWGKLVIHDRMGDTVELESIFLFEKWVEIKKELNLHTVLKLAEADEGRMFKLITTIDDEGKQSITSTFCKILDDLLTYFDNKEVAKILRGGKWYLAD